MAWTAPKTWAAPDDLTAAVLNTHLRDNMNETAAGIATAAGRMIVTDGANSLVERVPSQDVDTGSATFTNTSYLSLANVTGGSPFSGETAVTVTTGTEAIVFIRGSMANNTAATFTFLSYAVSGATTVSADDLWSLGYRSSNANDAFRAGTFEMRTGLTAGSNTFTLYAKASAGISSMDDVSICVIPL